MFKSSIYNVLPVQKEVEIYEKAKETYLRNKDKAKFKDKSSDWWQDSFGVRPEDFE
jgi:hypothetical protein